MTDPADQPPAILLVEDNPGDARLAEEAFADADLSSSLYTVTDGADALDFLYQRGQYATAPRPGVVFLDWNLPEVSGAEVLAEVKSDPEFSDVRVIVLLGSKVEEDIVKPDTHQPDAFITKPVEPADFTAAVEQIDA